MSQCGNERQGRPGAKRYFADQPLSSRRPAVAAHHVGRDSGLVDEDQLPWIKSPLLSSPGSARRSHVGAVLFSRVQDFFERQLQMAQKTEDRGDADLDLS